MANRTAPGENVLRLALACNELTRAAGMVDEVWLLVVTTVGGTAPLAEHVRIELLGPNDTVPYLPNERGIKSCGWGRLRLEPWA